MSALAWITVAAVAWLVIALAVGLLVGRVARSRDRQTPTTKETPTMTPTTSPAAAVDMMPAWYATLACDTPADLRQALSDALTDLEGLRSIVAEYRRGLHTAHQALADARAEAEGAQESGDAARAEIERMRKTWLAQRTRELARLHHELAWLRQVASVAEVVGQQTGYATEPMAALRNVLAQRPDGGA